jgi:hypothetical protein
MRRVGQVLVVDKAPTDIGDLFVRCLINIEDEQGNGAGVPLEATRKVCR